MMVSFENFRAMALAFPETSEQPHFEKTSFRVKQKIFATYDAANHKACLKLSAADQDVFALISQGAVFAVPNKWGQQGWTFANLEEVAPELFRDALTHAFCAVAPQKIARLIKPQPDPTE